MSEINGKCAVILAAEDGTRMKSEKPKVMAELLFRPMLDHVLDCARGSGIEDICAVIGCGGELVGEHIGGRALTVTQRERLGTGHAVMQAKDFLLAHSDGCALVLCGDAPLMDSETVMGAYDEHIRSSNAVTVISARVENPTGYGRIVRAADGSLLKIVEQRDASEEERRIDEVNSSAYWFSVPSLLEALDKLTLNTSAAKPGEYNFKDTVEILLGMGEKAGAFTAKNSDVVLGANDRASLLELNELARKKLLLYHMNNGVSIPCADGVIIAPNVEIGSDTVIMPSTILKSGVRIGKNCVIGANTLIEDSMIGNEVKLDNVQCFSSVIEDGAQIGPFVRVRPGSRICRGVRIGNFVEIKNSVIGENTSLSHLSYVGDSDVGKGVNFGCGFATANYNGSEKFRSTVGDGAFIGCDNTLVSPVKIGSGAYTAAGSTITEDVPDGALAVARTRQSIKAGWADRSGLYRKNKE